HGFASCPARFAKAGDGERKNAPRPLPIERGLEIVARPAQHFELDVLEIEIDDDAPSAPFQATRAPDFLCDEPVEANFQEGPEVAFSGVVGGEETPLERVRKESLGQVLRLVTILLPPETDVNVHGSEVGTYEKIERAGARRSVIAGEPEDRRPT